MGAKFFFTLIILAGLFACASTRDRQPTAAEIAESRMVSCVATDINACYGKARGICGDAYEVLHEPEPLPGRKEREIRIRCAGTEAGEGTTKL